MQAGKPAFLKALDMFVEALPDGAIESLAIVIAEANSGAWSTIQTTTQRVIAAPYYREQVSRFIAAWQEHAPEVPPASVALALQAVAHSIARRRQAETLELVWTGPASTQPLRRTALVIQRLIDEARHDLLIVSFAVYDIPEIGQALLRAARRGVRLQLIIESPKESVGKIAFDGLTAFGDEITSQAQIYRWPTEQRPTDADGRSGSLHAKCAVADDQSLLISSANLTHFALSLNLELGILMRGGALPGQVVRHFRHLSQTGVIVPTRP